MALALLQLLWLPLITAAAAALLMVPRTSCHDKCGNATVLLKASRACYNSTGGYMHGRNHCMALNGSVCLYFLDSYSYYVTGCMAMCQPSKHALHTGGCCDVSAINHTNVFKLLGCCLEVEIPMLVYEFISNGNLYHYIQDKTTISADTRLRIAAESAEALAYMHSSASPLILHGNVKSANILLDDKLTAKVFDFGASRFAPTDEAEVATLVQGTCGYLDPEYLQTCQLTIKCDVYSFGVFILELLKKAFYLDGPEDDRSLAFCFLRAMQEDRYLDILDRQVKDKVKGEVLNEIVDLVIQCLSMIGKKRPTMKEVAEKLERVRRNQQNPEVQQYNPEENEEVQSKSGQPLWDDVEQKTLYNNCVPSDVTDGRGKEC